LLKIKRIYEKAAADDGYRVLVDRLWPRGVSKEDATLDLWLKDVAPSPELRTWFDHKPERFTEFSKRYTAELHDNPATAELAKISANHKTVTLLYGAKDPEINHVVVLQRYLKR
jgi:uncharacterized protein YeaO (DUF488 family)